MILNSAEREKVDAFLSNDVQWIIRAHTKDRDMPWYKFLGKDVYTNLMPIQSNMLKLVINSKVNTLWRKTRTDSDIFTLEFIRELEEKIQIYGDAVVKLDYLDGELNYRIIDDNFSVEKDDFGNVEKFTLNYYYELEDENGNTIKLKVVQEHYGREEYNRVFDISESEKEISYDEYEITSNFVPSRINKHAMAFYFENNVSAKNILSQINSIDEAKSQIVYIGRMGVPFVIEPIETRMAAMQGGGVDNTTASESAARRYNGLLKNEYQQGDYQKPEFIQPDIEIEFYEKSIDSLVKDVCRIYGISPVSVGYDNLSANASASALQERKEMSIDTKIATRHIRLEALNSMFDEIGIVVSITIDDNENEFDLNKSTFFYNMYKQGDLSYSTLVNVIFPYWEDKDKKDELDAISSDKLKGNIG